MKSIPLSMLFGVFFLIVGLQLFTGPTVAQTNSTGLLVSGAVEQPLNLALSELSQMPRTRLTTREKDGKEVMFEGVALSEIVKRARPAITRQCCSNAVNTIVVVHAADGYRALFSLPELDPEFGESKILLADRREGEPIVPSQGPLRLIAPDDKVHGRWVRQVKAVEIVIVGSLTNAPSAVQPAPRK